MRPNHLRIIAGTLALSLSATTATADCWLFEHEAFQGQAFAMKANQVVDYLGDMDNKASSIRVGPGCLLIAHDLPGLQGPSQTWGPGDYSSLPVEWNDVISSAQCNCRP